MLKKGNQMHKHSAWICAAAVTISAAHSFGAEKKPNIIVIVTDDHGYADLSCMNKEPDVKTPNLDRLAAEGVRFTNGYVTAPQCAPSRAGLLTGRYQERFGFNCNGKGPLPLDEPTLADRLKQTGYTTGMVGKWHMEPLWNDQAFIDQHIPGAESLRERYDRISLDIIKQYHPFARGFQETFFGYINEYWITYDVDGNRFKEPQFIKLQGDRLDHQSAAALQFIDDYHKNPFFLYLSYYGPHVPLASSEKYLKRFPGDMPERRRVALAMISSIDDGVGRIMDRLQQYGIDENTLIVFLSDNGAPIKLTMEDITLDYHGGAWDGSKNTPLNGEKGMLSEGGIRVPFLLRWKGTVPGGQVLDTPVISLDISATACNAAGLEKPETLDGENLLPLLTEKKPLPDRALYWRFWEQTAIRKGKWKFLKLGNQQSFLFNLADDPEETANLLKQHPEVATELEQSLRKWADELNPPGVPNSTGQLQEVFWYNHFFHVPLPEGIDPTMNPFSQIGK